MTEQTPKHYRIIELRAENIKRLSVVNIRPDGNVVQITGPNGNGKTSVLDAIEWAFAGKRPIQGKPIREGEESALIRVDLGELKVTRKFTALEGGEYTTSLKVEGPEGQRYEQGMLTALLGEFSFDPMAFTRMKPDEQFEAVRTLVPGVDFDGLAQADKDDFAERAEWNRKAKDRRAQATGITLPPGAIPAAVDTAALEAKLAEAATHNADVERRRGVRQQARDRVAAIDEQLVALQAERAGLLGRLETAEALPEPIDVADVQAQLTAGRQAQAVRDAAARREALEQEAAEAEAKSKALTQRMEEREAQKQAAIAAAKMPVPGLSFGAGAVLLNGQPFEQASRAEQWMASVGIAAALNPRLRVIRILDGSLLDDSTMASLAKMAEQLDLQIWIERVDSSGSVGFVLEDGHLKGEAPPNKVRERSSADEDVI